MELENKIVVVTGATSGMGRATALACARAGADVVIGGRNADAAVDVATEVEALGRRSRTVLGDIADSTYCDELIGCAVADLGRVSVLVNAAGVIARVDGPATTDDEWHRVMRANVDGTFFASRAAVRAMRGTGGGVIVNISSTVGLVGTAGMPAYCASKGAVSNLTRAMAVDHAAENIRINAVCPGSVDTPMLQSERHRNPMTADEVFAMNVADIPQARIPTADEVADVVVFLASDRSAHIVGANISVDGGYTAQ